MVANAGIAHHALLTESMFLYLQETEAVSANF